MLRNPVILPDLFRYYHFPEHHVLTARHIDIMAVLTFDNLLQEAAVDVLCGTDFPKIINSLLKNMQTSRSSRFHVLKNSIVITCMIAFSSLPLICFAQSSQTTQGPEPFFVMGSGKLHLKNLRNKQEARVELLTKDGALDDAAFTEVDRVFGFPTAEKEEHISPRLLFMLSYFADRVAPGKTINIESAYRSPDYNDKIRKKGANAAKTSTHMDGMALDFWIEGVGGKSLWQTVREKNCCGVGHYGGKTIHLDAGRPRFWEAATSGTKSKEPDYNRHVYLSTDIDRYTANDNARLSLSGISTFGFGVKPTVHFFNSTESEEPGATASMTNENKTDCIKINDHKSSRFLAIAIPVGLKVGLYKVRVDFCERPFSQMPAEIFSNDIEILKQTQIITAD